MVKMGIGVLGKSSICIKRKYRWQLIIPEISVNGTNALPPEKSARPNLSFKEIEVHHLNETVFYPGKPEWKPLNLVLYDIKRKKDPIFGWLKEQYDPCLGEWKAPSPSVFKKEKARLEMYDGCGKIIETWVYENVWPQSIEWGDLEMGNSEYSTVDLTLRYDRAYIEEEC